MSAARSGRPAAPLPADWPADAGERPAPGQKGWTLTNERNGVKIKVVCEVGHKCFIACDSKSASKIVPWRKSGGVQKAWEIAKKKAGWDK